MDERGVFEDPTTGRPAISVWSPDSHEAWLVVDDPSGTPQRIAMRRDVECWTAELPDVADGTCYHLEVDGVGPLLDPYAHAVHREGDVFRSVVRRRPWPVQPQLGAPPLTAASVPPGGWPVVYELHVRGFGRTFRGVIGHLDHVADLGVDVIELMPVHPFDSTDSYWGYMPLVWGAVHEEYAATGDGIDELAELVAAAHARGLQVWLDVVFNHTAEKEPEHGTTTSWRGLAEHRAYAMRDGRYRNDSGCGNDMNVGEYEIERAILTALERYATIGVDGFRFDLATLLTRDGGGLVRRIGDWAERRGVSLIAEPWDLGAYELGDAFPDPRWSQWNDRFREDVRGFLRAEPGLVGALAQRVQGSPDRFPAHPWRSLNFITAHDGLTLHDLTAVTDDHHRAWDCGPELRLQQLKNAFCYLLLSSGPAMFVMGDEMGRSQENDPNPYDIDGPRSWLDWSLVERWGELRDFVRDLLALRRAHPIVDVQLHGAAGEPDLGWESRSLAWSTDHVAVIANTWWEPLAFQVPRTGRWQVHSVTAPLAGPSPSPRGAAVDGGSVVTLAPRSILVLTR